jgi:putative FmdB family regulatory protein
MPIYAYRCASCGHSRDVLQKISDPQLTTCPACGIEQFQKQITAAGFQLKGSGWYATDFKGGNGPAPAAAPASSNGAGDAAGATCVPQRPRRPRTPDPRLAGALVGHGRHQRLGGLLRLARRRQLRLPLTISPPMHATTAAFARGGSLS